MGNEDHIARLKNGVVAWNAWRNENRNIRPDLSRADLSRADLSGAHLYEADLSGAHLHEADLSRAQLPWADLSRAQLPWANLHEANLSVAKLVGAKLVEANLIGANLSVAKLVGANLREAQLNWADLREAQLGGANLTEAKLGWTVFGDIDLTSVIGLETCKHDGPSIIDYQTLAQSGPLPLSFLRGVGLPDNFIEYIPAFAIEPSSPALFLLHQLLD